MRRKNIFHALIITISLTALAFSGWQPSFAKFATSGLFTIIWGENRSGLPVEIYTLTDDSGQTSSLSMDESLAVPLGGVLALDRQRITVSGLRMLPAFGQGNQATIEVESIGLEKSTIGAQGPSGQQVAGSQPFLSIMCKFSDIAATPKSLTYFKNMYSNVHPGLDNYWREVSYLTANIAGSNALGWYTLPHPRSYYLPGGSLSFSLAAQDCTAAADADVNFAPYKGINLMFNSDLDGYAWGGGQYMTLDGVTNYWPMTWEPPWGYSDITVISHEMGHAFGLPHSSGTYGQTYDNQWDVMSDNWANCSNSSDPTYGCLAQHTISYHKDKLGWIPAARKYTAAANTQATITLEQLALLPSSNYLMAQIPIGGSSTHFYTVEVRRRTVSTYDIKLPGQAVIIHEVDTTRLNPANVIDSDNDGDPRDAGTMWTVGETFSDAANKISVKVLSATSTGFQVTIQSGPPQTTAVFKSLGANDGWILESGENSGAGGALNSVATTFNLGDDAANKQYRAILHFDTSSLPDTAVVTKVTLKIMKQGLVGTNPFSTHGALKADIRKPYFGASAALLGSHFQATASSPAAAFGATPAGSWYSAILNSVGKTFVNRTGPTQFRLSFTLDDNNDHDADYMSFYSGNAPIANRPQLIVQYYVP
jgi:M6 family metalloprotease-like protein